MLDTASTALLADFLRHKLLNEKEFAVVRVKNDGEFKLGVRDTLPWGSAGEPNMLLSRYTLGQLAERSDAELEQSVRTMMSEQFERNPLYHLIYSYCPKRGLGCNDSPLFVTLPRQTEIAICEAMFSGMPFAQAIDVDSVMQGIQQYGLKYTAFKAVPPEQLREAVQHYLEQMEKELKPQLDAYQEGLNETLPRLAQKLRRKAKELAEPYPPVTDARAIIIARDMPEEIELLLRSHTDMHDLSGSVIFTETPEKFYRRNVGTVKDGTDFLGTYIWESGMLIATDSDVPVDGNLSISGWRTVAEHEIVHLVNAALPPFMTGVSGFISDDVLDEEKLERIFKQTTVVERLLMTGPEDKNAKYKHWDLKDQMQEALFPIAEGEKLLSRRQMEEISENLLYYSGMHDYRGGSEGRPLDQQQDEVLTQAIDMVHTIASELQLVDTQCSRKNALARAHKALAIISPELASVVGSYWQNRDHMLDQLRLKQGALEQVVSRDPLPESMQVPSPHLANSHGAARVRHLPDVAKSHTYNSPGRNV